MRLVAQMTLSSLQSPRFPLVVSEKAPSDGWSLTIARLRIAAVPGQSLRGRDV